MKPKRRITHYTKRKRQYRLYKTAVFVLIFMLCAGIFLFWRAYSPPTAGTMRTSPTLTASAASTANGQKDDGGLKQQSTGLLQETEPAAQDYLADALFVGDSRTNAMQYYGVLKQEQVVAVDGMNHIDAQTNACIQGENGLCTIAQAVGQKKPAKVFVAFGINGLAWMSEDVFIAEYEKLLDQLREQSPESVFIVQSVLPVSAGYEKKDPRVLNEKIDEYNQALLALAQQKGMYFLNTAEALKDSDNCLDEAYNSGDGMHFAAETYTVIIDYILTHDINGELVS